MNERTEGPPAFNFSAWLFLRFMGGIYFAAFVSLGVQINGLVGADGILPAGHYLGAVHERYGWLKYWLLPTLAWISSSDGFLQFLCWGGAFFSLLIFFDIAPAILLFLAWLFYLSLVHVGQEFMSFQWDILLLESGFLAIFLSSLHLFPTYPLARRENAPKIAVGLLRWLLFRLMFSSGVVKLTSGDPAWRNLTALNYHYETQPLPTWVGWYAHQLPHWFHKFSAGAMFSIELIIPFLIFAPRRFRVCGCFLLISLQCLIMVTGNYCFFNLLALNLCLLLLDDAVWPKFLTRLVFYGAGPSAGIENDKISRNWPKGILIALAALILLLSFVPMTSIFRRRIPFPRPVLALYQIFQPFYLVNGYGLFAMMTTSRPEIIIEGSENGVDWSAYEFKWKPGTLDRKPGFVEPHQPRLDWQMWFAALSSYRYQPWFLNFMARLLQGSPDVLRLLANNPFPEKPPARLRAVMYDYHFTDMATMRESGDWWRRVYKGLYCPVLVKKEGRIAFE